MKPSIIKKNIKKKSYKFSIIKNNFILFETKIKSPTSNIFEFQIQETINKFVVKDVHTFDSPILANFKFPSSIIIKKGLKDLSLYLAKLSDKNKYSIFLLKINFLFINLKIKQKTIFFTQIKEILLLKFFDKINNNQIGCFNSIFFACTRFSNGCNKKTKNNIDFVLPF